MVCGCLSSLSLQLSLTTDSAAGAARPGDGRKEAAMAEGRGAWGVHLQRWPRAEGREAAIGDGRGPRGMWGVHRI